MITPYIYDARQAKTTLMAKIMNNQIFYELNRKYLCQLNVKKLKTIGEKLVENFNFWVHMKMCSNVKFNVTLESYTLTSI